MKGITNEAELRTELGKDCYAFRFDYGYCKSAANLTIKDKDDFINVVWLHHIFFVPHAELEQLRKGFRETLEVEILCLQHPDKLVEVLAANKLFIPSSKHFIDEAVIDYSDNGSNDRTKEEAIVVNWNNFVNECETSPNGMSLFLALIIL